MTTSNLVSDTNLALNPDLAEDITPRASELVVEHQNRIYSQTSRLFTILMLVQWVAGIAAALAVGKAIEGFLFGVRGTGHIWLPDAQGKPAESGSNHEKMR